MILVDTGEMNPIQSPERDKAIGCDPGGPETSAKLAFASII
jgi:hypothetical protein